MVKTMTVKRVITRWLFMNNNTKQYARLTRSENELSGNIKMKNLPTADPQVADDIQ